MRNIFINDYHSSSNKYTVFDNEEGTIMNRYASNPGEETPDSADRMNLPIGTVKSRIYASRQQLQSKLRDYHYDA